MDLVPHLQSLDRQALLDISFKQAALESSNLSRYLIVSFVAEGTFGRVYKAVEALDLSRFYAVKFGASKREQSRLQALKACRHVVSAVSIWEEVGKSPNILVMEHHDAATIQVR
jgi:serine/threonine protein kinase